MVGFCSSADDTEPETCRQYSLMILKAGTPLIAISLRTKIIPTIPVLYTMKGMGNVKSRTKGKLI